MAAVDVQGVAAPVSAPLVTSARYALPATQQYAVPAGQPLATLGVPPVVSPTIVQVNETRMGNSKGKAFFLWFFIIAIIFFILLLLFRPAAFYTTPAPGSPPVQNWGMMILWSVIIGVIAGAIAAVATPSKV